MADEIHAQDDSEARGRRQNQLMCRPMPDPAQIAFAVACRDGDLDKIKELWYQHNPEYTRPPPDEYTRPPPDHRDIMADELHAQDDNEARGRRQNQLMCRPLPDPDQAAFLAACRDGDLDKIKELWDEVWMFWHATGLNEALTARHATLVRYFLANGTPLHAPTKEAYISKGEMDVLNFLYDQGWVPGGTEIAIAAEAGNMDSANWLLDHGVQATQKTLLVAAFYGCIPLFDLALSCGVSLQDTRVLHTAAGAKQVDMIAHILALPGGDEGLNRLDTDYEDMAAIGLAYSRGTPLHWAAWIGSAETVAYLVERGAERDVKDRDGRPPSHWAHCCDWPTQQLLSNGPARDQEYSRL
ncbi:ankyrin repeat-containing domain protein [Xylariaceae sp. FL0804]|nr:ankyrin repeat-containing domain protein [Xylariaceae sp. FL0804]